MAVVVFSLFAVIVTFISATRICIDTVPPLTVVNDFIHIHENGDDMVVEVVGANTGRCALFSSAADYVASASRQFSNRIGHFHDIDGLLVTSCASVAGEGDVHIYFVQLGQLFMWPPGVLGLRRTLRDLVTPGLARPVQLHTLSKSPRVFSVAHLLTEQEADALVEEALTREDDDEEGDALQRSSVGRGDARAVSAVRTGQTAWLAGSPLAVQLQARVLQLLRASPQQQAPTDATWVEDVQILKYEENDMFAFHYDIQGGGGNSSCSCSAAGDRCHSYDTETGGSDRFATVMFYLSDVARGGHTAFSLADEWWDADRDRAVQRQEGAARDSACLLAGGGGSYSEPGSLAVRPQRLHALLFYSQSPAGAPDWTSLHAGCPVVQGVKWVANVWVWNGPRKPFWCARQQYRSRERPSY